MKGKKVVVVRWFNQTLCRPKTRFPPPPVSCLFFTTPVIPMMSLRNSEKPAIPRVLSSMQRRCYRSAVLVRDVKVANIEELSRVTRPDRGFHVPDRSNRLSCSGLTFNGHERILRCVCVDAARGDYVAPTFRLVRLLGRKDGNGPGWLGVPTEGDGGRNGSSGRGTHQRNTCVVKARSPIGQGSLVGAGVKAKRGAMGEEKSTRGRRKYSSFGEGGHYVTVCGRREMGGETARTEIAGGYSRFHAHYDRPAFGFHENHCSDSNHPVSRLPVSPPPSLSLSLLPIGRSSF